MYNAELQMLRELTWFLLGVQVEDKFKVIELQDFRCCCFCRQPFITLYERMTFGHRRHPKVKVKVTIHHLDENRANNHPDNLRLCHSKCHRAFHKRLLEAGGTRATNS